MKTLVLGLALVSSVAMAGKEGGNGGGSHYCSGRSFQEVYDVYEGYNRYNIKPTGEKLSLKQHIDRAILRLKNANYEMGVEIEKAVQYIQDGHMLIRPNLKLELIPDANILITDHGCSYKQLANWDDVSGNILVDGRIFDQLDSLNKAALYIHEAVYKVARDRFGAENSDDVRKIVAHAMSSGGYDFEVFYKTIVKVPERAKAESYSMKDSEMTEEQAKKKYNFELYYLNSLYMNITRNNRVKEIKDLNVHLADANILAGDLEIKVSVVNSYKKAIEDSYKNLVVKLEEEKTSLESKYWELRKAYDLIPKTKYEEEIDNIQQFRYHKKYDRLYKKAQKLKTPDEKLGKDTGRQANKKQQAEVDRSIESNKEALKITNKLMNDALRANGASQEQYILNKESSFSGYLVKDYLNFDLGAARGFGKDASQVNAVITFEVLKRGEKVFETSLSYNASQIEKGELIFVNLNLSQNPLR